MTQDRFLALYGVPWTHEPGWKYLHRSRPDGTHYQILWEQISLAVSYTVHKSVSDTDMICHKPLRCNKVSKLQPSLVPTPIELESNILGSLPGDLKKSLGGFKNTSVFSLRWDTLVWMGYQRMQSNCCFQKIHSCLKTSRRLRTLLCSLLFTWDDWSGKPSQQRSPEDSCVGAESELFHTGSRTLSHSLAGTVLHRYSPAPFLPWLDTDWRSGAGRRISTLTSLNICIPAQRPTGQSSETEAAIHIQICTYGQLIKCLSLISASFACLWTVEGHQAGVPGQTLQRPRNTHSG